MAQLCRITPAQDYYVSTEGNDAWSGIVPKPNKAKTDGPFATVAQAQKTVRQLKTQGLMTGPVTVHLRGGTYALEAPLVFTPADSGSITYAAYRSETPILSGGRRITGWANTRVNGKRAWVADIPEVREGKWYFRSLYVNNERRERARTPRANEALWRLAEVPGMPVPCGWRNEHYNRFRFPAGAMRAFRNLQDIEVVLFHFWIDERFPITAFDAKTNMITSSRASRAPLVEAWGSLLAPGYVENVFEALTEPGQWYLDRGEGKLYYIPRKGENMKETEVIAPRLYQLLRLEGAPAAGRHVEHLRFQGITFAHTDWVQPGPEVEALMAPQFVTPGRAQHHTYRKTLASTSQGAADVPGAIFMTGARYCALENCRIANIGWTGVQLADGCRGNRVVGNELVDLGAGGVNLDGAAAGEERVLLTGENRITDNHIHSGGHVFHSGIGVLAMNSFGNTISHNHIHDFYYSGISCGWVWGYAENVSRDNRIEKNHIHDLGKGLLSDMGGIYTLGVQPGTVLRGNLIHNVEKLNYGAWCIYPDEGSSHILIENNVCYDTNGEIFHQHYGRENLVRNNIFAFGEDWQALGHDRHSLIADPLCKNAAARDFRLEKKSPAFAIGFEPIDLSDVGPRPPKRRD